MPFALVVIGLLLIVTGARDTHKQFGELLVKDFTGPNNFTYWLVSFGVIGALGYNETLKPFSRAFMFLIITGMIIRNGGFFDKFSQALKAGPANVSAPTAQAGAQTGAVTPNSAISALNKAGQSIGLPTLPALPSFPGIGG